MTHDQENTGEALAQPAGANELAAQPWTTRSAATLADPHAECFDNMHDAQQAAQAGAACGQYPSGGTVPNVAPTAPVSPAVGVQHQRKDPFAGLFGGNEQPAEPTWEKPVPLRAEIKNL